MTFFERSRETLGVTLNTLNRTASSVVHEDEEEINRTENSTFVKRLTTSQGITRKKRREEKYENETTSQRENKKKIDLKLFTSKSSEGIPLIVHSDLKPTTQ